MINHLAERRETGHAKDHLIADMASHMAVSDHGVRARRKRGTDQEAEAQEEDLVVEVPERVDHGAEVQEETRIGLVVGALKGKDLEAEVQEGTGIGHKALMASKDLLHQKKSISIVIVFM